MGSLQLVGAAHIDDVSILSNDWMCCGHFNRRRCVLLLWLGLEGFSRVRVNVEIKDFFDH